MLMEGGKGGQRKTLSDIKGLMKCNIRFNLA